MGTVLKPFGVGTRHNKRNGAPMSGVDVSYAANAPVTNNGTIPANSAPAYVPGFEEWVSSGSPSATTYSAQGVVTNGTTGANTNTTPSSDPFKTTLSYENNMPSSTQTGAPETVMQSTGAGGGTDGQDVTYGNNGAPSEAPSGESTGESTGGETSGGSTGGETTGGTEADPLEEYYKNFNSSQKELLDTSYAANATIRENAEKDADAARDRAIIDARSDAELRETSYGANAEALESRGLSVSGYGDYIGAQSYAQMRGETQNANAQAEYLKRKAAEQETLANKEADLTYAANIDANAKEYAAYLKSKSDSDFTYKSAAFNDIYNKVLNGASIEDAKIWAAEAGIELTDGQLGLLNTAAQKYGEGVTKEDTTYKAQTLATLYDAILSGSYDLEGAKAFAATLGIELTESDLSLLNTAVEKYGEGVTKEDATYKAQTLATLYDAILSGSYDLEGAKAFAATLGIELTESDLSLLNTAAQKYGEGAAKTETSYKMGILTNLYSSVLGGMTLEDAKAAAAGWGLTLDENDEAYLQGAVTRYQNGMADMNEEETQARIYQYMEWAKSGKFTSEELESLLKAENLGVAYTEGEGENAVEKSWADLIMEMARSLEGSKESAEKQGHIESIYSAAISGASSEELALMQELWGLGDEDIQAALDFAVGQDKKKAQEDYKIEQFNYLELLDIASKGQVSEVYIKEYCYIAQYSTEQEKELLDALGAYNTSEEGKQKQGHIESIYSAAISGASSEELALMQELWGLGDEDIQAALDFAVSQDKKKAEADAKESMYQYADLMGMVSAGQVTAEYIAAYCSAAGFDYTQKTALMNALDEYNASEEGKQKQGYVETLIVEASGGMSEATIRALAKQWGLSEDDISTAIGVSQATIKQQQNENFANLLAQYGDDVGAINALVQAGSISSDDANTIITEIERQWNQEITDYMQDIFWTGQYDEEGDEIRRDITDAYGEIERILSDPLCSEQTAEKLVRRLVETYSVYTICYKFGAALGITQRDYFGEIAWRTKDGTEVTDEILYSLIMDKLFTNEDNLPSENHTTEEKESNYGGGPLGGGPGGRVEQQIKD